MGPLVLSVDIGTSSLRVFVFDGEGKRLPDVGVQIAYEPETTPEGGATLVPDQLLQKTLGAIEGALNQLGKRCKALKAVALCTMWHSVLGVDKRGEAITPFLLWADSRCVREAEELKRSLDERAYHARTGCFFHTSYLPPKLLWFRRAFPEVARRVVRWLSFGEYLHLRLFKMAACSFSMASGTGLFDQERGDWDEEILNALGLSPESLSPLTDFAPLETSRPSPLVPEALRDVLWFPPLGDGACSNIGCGAVTPDTIALMVGTSSVMRVMTTDVPEVPFGLWRYRADTKRQLIGGAQSNGGIIFQWLTETLQLPEGWEGLLATMGPDEHGLTVLPFLLGERSPEWDASVPSAIVGVRRHHRPIHFLRAFMEAVALRMVLIHDLIRKTLPRGERLIATGRALLRSRVWAKIFADALGQPLTLCLETEASARGAALMALEALGVLPDIADAPFQWGETIDPDPSNHDRYRRALERQRSLYEAMSERFRTI